MYQESLLRMRVKIQKKKVWVSWWVGVLASHSTSQSKYPTGNEDLWDKARLITLVRILQFLEFFIFSKMKIIVFLFLLPTN